MIADWTVDVGAPSPSIDVPWEGWRDLRGDRRRDIVEGLVEVQAYPELRQLLQALNSDGLLTSKVDVFPVSRDEVDPEIAEAGMEQTACGVGSYIDVLMDWAELAWDFGQFECAARVVAADLDKIGLAAPCLAEIVVRPACVFGKQTFGWTVYAIGFGATEAEARLAWAAAGVALTGEIVREVGALVGQTRRMLADASA